MKAAGFFKYVHNLLVTPRVKELKVRKRFQSLINQAVTLL